jgi:hypothetical protein
MTKRAPDLNSLLLNGISRRQLVQGVIGFGLAATLACTSSRAAAPAPHMMISCPPPVASVATPPLAVHLPAGIDLTMLAGQAAPVPFDAVGEEVPLSFLIQLEHITIGPGLETNVGDMHGPELLYVEAGQLVLVTEGGRETPPQCAGSQLLLHAGRDYTASNRDTEPATLLRLSIEPIVPTTAAEWMHPNAIQAIAALAPPGPAATRPAATPGANETRTLMVADLKPSAVPSGSVLLFIARTVWQPGAAMEASVFTGPVGLVVESGILTGLDPLETFPVTFPKDTFVVYEPGVIVSQRNTASEPATVLLAGAVAAGQQLIVPASADIVIPTWPPEPSLSDLLDEMLQDGTPEATSPRSDDCQVGEDVDPSGPLPCR